MLDALGAPNAADAAAAQGDLQERALLAAVQWANADTPIVEALAYRNGFVAGASQHAAVGEALRSLTAAPAADAAPAAHPDGGDVRTLLEKALYFAEKVSDGPSDRLRRSAFIAEVKKALTTTPATAAHAGAMDAIDKAIDKLIYTAWYSGEQDGAEGVTWQERGDSYNGMLRDRIQDDKRALLSLLAAPTADSGAMLTVEQHHDLKFVLDLATRQHRFADPSIVRLRTLLAAAKPVSVATATTAAVDVAVAHGEPNTSFALGEALRGMIEDAENTYNAAKSGRPLEISVGQFRRLAAAKALLTSPSQHDAVGAQGEPDVIQARHAFHLESDDPQWTYGAWSEVSKEAAQTLRAQGGFEIRELFAAERIANRSNVAVGEEIHVHVMGCDVYSLPLQASGMEPPTGPRFVVHVPSAVGETVAWAAVHFGGPRNGKIYNTCDTKEDIGRCIAQVHQSSDSITLTARPIAFADATPIPRVNDEADIPQLADVEERLVHAADDGARSARAGTHELIVDEDGCAGLPSEHPAQEGDRPICRFRWREDRGDPGIGMPGFCGWVLADDQSGTLLADLSVASSHPTDTPGATDAL
ncbi:hypothetical protein [Paraburkholderia humisilvae]|uniref:hypothetical protein n=1 Tax=Paraburkholderia humisilvae TaxID=627669 RepID=UPI001583D522|nr:hypothetical protein [Paraburkholderia humisilvae]